MKEDGKRGRISIPSENIEQKAASSDAFLRGWQDYARKRGYTGGTENQRSRGRVQREDGYLYTAVD